MNRARIAALFLLIVAALLLFSSLGARGLWTAEGRWAEISREMFLSGDFFHPTIGGEPYFDKPLLTYWLICLVSLLTGHLTEATVRWPSALAGLLALAATWRLGRRLWDGEVGRIAAWILLTTYGFLFWSRTASAETENMAAVILCLSWYWARRDKPGFTTFFVFYLIAFLGSLTKGLTALVVPVLAVLPDLLRNKRYRSLFSFSHFLALALALGVYLSPFIYASLTRPESYGESGLDLVFRENIVRYFQPFDHRGPIYTYFGDLPVLFLPWAPLLIVAVGSLLFGWKKLSEKTRWLLQAAGLIFLFFSLSGSRRSYYILPVLPLCALGVAVYLQSTGGERLKRGTLLLQKYLFTLLAGISVVAPLLWLVIKTRTAFAPPPGLLWIVSGGGAAALLLGWFLSRREAAAAWIAAAPRHLAPAIAMAAVLLSGYFCLQLPLLEAYRTERPFARRLKVRTENLPAADIVFFPDVSSNVVFYLGRSKPPRVLKTEEELAAFLKSASGQVLACKRKYIQKIPPALTALLPDRPLLEEKVFPWEKRKARKKLAAWDLNKK